MCKPIRTRASKEYHEIAIDTEKIDERREIWGSSKVIGRRIQSRNSVEQVDGWKQKEVSSLKYVIK